MSSLEKKLFVKFLALILALGLLAQQSSYSLSDPILDPNSVIPPSPTVANLIDFEEVPVNHYTGQPNITIPLYSKQIHRDLGFNLQLGYSSNGVKINNRSSWIGTGWSLSGLGVVSKTVKGVPDEMMSAHAVGLWNEPNIEPFDFEQRWRTYGENGKRYDSQYDVFNAVYPGGSVEFIIKSNGSNTLVPVIINSSGEVSIAMDFTYDSNPSYPNEASCTAAGKPWVDTYTYKRPNTFPVQYVTVPAYCADNEIIEISSFTIIDATGKRFKFDAFEYTSSQPISAPVSQGSGEVGNLNASQVSNFYTTRSAWHLTEIYPGPSNDTKLLTVEYNFFDETYTSRIDYTENEINLGASQLTTDDVEEPYNKGILKPAREIQYFTTSAGTAKPKKISFGDGTYIELNHETNYSHPETNGVVLRSIERFDRAGNRISETILSHETTSDNERLWFTQLSEFNSDLSEEKRYTFDYKNKQSLPKYDAQTDIWGFIPQDLSKLGKVDDPIKTGLLTSVTYPSGGKKEFEWEHHTFSYAGSQEYSVDQQNDNPNNWVTRTERVVATGQVSAADGTFFLFEHNFSLPSHISPTVRLIRLNITPVNPLDQPFDETNATFRIIRDGNVADVVFQQLISEFRNQNLQDGQGITPGNFTAGIMIPDNTLYNIDAEFFINYEVLVTSSSSSQNLEKWVYGGGPRIKEIRFTDRNETQRKWTFDYRNKEAGKGNYSSGAIDGLFTHYKPGYQQDVETLLIFGSFIEQRRVRYNVIKNHANAKMTKGSYVGYKYVTVREEGKGYARYHFTTPNTYPSNSTEFIYPFHVDNSIDEYRGHLKTQIDFDQYLMRDTVESELVGIDEEGNQQIETLTWVEESYRFLPKQTVYFDYDFPVESIATSYMVAPSYQCPYFQLYTSYQTDTDASILTNCPYNGEWVNCNFTVYPCTDEINGYSPFLLSSLDHVNIWPKLTKKTTSQYEYEDGTDISKTIMVTEDYTYNSTNRLVSSQKISRAENGKTVDDYLRYYYSAGPYPTGIFSAEEINQFQTNKDRNRINDLVFLEGTEDVNNGSVSLDLPTLKGQKKVTYSNLNNGVYEIAETASRKSRDQEFRNDVNILRVDDYGNILEFQTADGVTHVYIYGYKGSVVLATIQNSTYDQAVAGVDLNILDNPPSPGGPNHVNLQLAYLRSNLVGASVLGTTYHYNDRMQLAKVIDPNSLEIFYHYDDFGRLLRVVDHEGNMLEENVYHFRN